MQAGQLRATGLFASGNRMAGSAFTPLMVDCMFVAGGGILDRNRLYDRAHELAASGEHIDCITIVAARTSEGFTEAAEASANEQLRSELRQICRQHWRHDRSHRKRGVALRLIPTASKPTP